MERQVIRQQIHWSGGLHNPPSTIVGTHVAILKKKIHNMFIFYTYIKIYKLLYVKKYRVDFFTFQIVEWNVHKTKKK